MRNAKRSLRATLGGELRIAKLRSGEIPGGWREWRLGIFGVNCTSALHVIPGTMPNLFSYLQLAIHRKVNRISWAINV
ncbi:MAG: hypothetical protein JWM68_4658 [Verrucomicrobiales bacterium]|nr:hypothetical protein [Verrucomicrobiales bacterium]